VSTCSNAGRDIRAEAALNKHTHHAYTITAGRRCSVCTHRPCAGAGTRAHRHMEAADTCLRGLPRTPCTSSREGLRMNGAISFGLPGVSRSCISTCRTRLHGEKPLRSAIVSSSVPSSYSFSHRGTCHREEEHNWMGADAAHAAGTRSRWFGDLFFHLAVAEPRVVRGELPVYARQGVIRHAWGDDPCGLVRRAHRDHTSALTRRDKLCHHRVVGLPRNRHSEPLCSHRRTLSLAAHLLKNYPPPSGLSTGRQGRLAAPGASGRGHLHWRSASSSGRAGPALQHCAASRDTV
jgi:hypothetical protein